ncbi:MAG: SDR family oxidoreductase, partial [bacterium]
LSPSMVIHAAALTDTTVCEQDQDRAIAVNVEGTVNLLQGLEPEKCFVAYVSTDLVYEGRDGPYGETYTPQPLNFYGQTKMAGEEVIGDWPGRSLILRPALLFGPASPNKASFLGWFKENFEAHKPLELFVDEFRSPLCVEDFFPALWGLYRKKATGVFNVGGNKTYSRFDMGSIFAKRFGYDETLIQKRHIAEVNTPAPRPANVALKIEKLVRATGFSPRNYERGLQIMK